MTVGGKCKDCGVEYSVRVLEVGDGSHKWEWNTVDSLE
jgi:hypothetical protein